MRFLLGFVCGLLVLGGYVGYQEVQRRDDPCRGHCGAELECVEGVCLVPEPEAKTKRKRRKRRRRRWRRRGRRARPGTEVAAASDEPELRQPTAAELKPQTKGPSLRQTEYVDLASSGAGGRELSSAEIDASVRKRSMRIVACIDKARGDLDINRGKVTVGFRIERSGQVKKVRVSAPSALMRRGLYGCVKPLITGLRFGATSRSLIMSYPYALN